MGGVHTKKNNNATRCFILNNREFNYMALILLLHFFSPQYNEDLPKALKWFQLLQVFVYILSYLLSL